MNHKKSTIVVIVIILLSATVMALAQDGDPPFAQSEPASANAILGTSFHHQGSLAQNGQAANGPYEFEFRLYDAAAGGNQVGGAIARTLQVDRGLFTTDLDFGASAWDGRAYYLQIAVRNQGSASPHSVLSPRHSLTAVPYALALPGLQTQQNATSPNLIGGHAGNIMGAGVTGGVIAGGGSGGLVNRVYDTGATVGGGIANRAGSDDGNATTQNHATVGGGSHNTASGNAATVGGGSQNTAATSAATVGGGLQNTASGNSATVGGGTDNQAGGSSAAVCGGTANTASGQGASVGGGEKNHAGGKDSVIGGGSDNQSTGEDATVGGGQKNHAGGKDSVIGGGSDNQSAGADATVGGGQQNSAPGPQASVGGGGQNLASGQSSTVGGGSGNVASHTGGAVCGGEGNTAADAHSTVAGGKDNGAVKGGAAVGGGSSNISSGEYATIPGGLSNTAAGGYSLAAGRRARAEHRGAFVWADSTNADFASPEDDTFNIRARNGVNIEANTGDYGLYIANSGAGHAVRGQANATSGASFGVYGVSASPDGYAGYFSNASTNGTALLAQSSGSGKSKATLRANNTEASGGVTAYLTNNSDYANVHAYNGGSGEVLYLQNGGVDGMGIGGGDFIRAVNEPQSDTQFRVTTAGGVFSDVGFNTPAADFAEMLPGAPGLEPGDVLAIGLDGRLVRTTVAYEPAVVGVYSTRPGFVGGMPVEGETEGRVPLAVVGVVPVKASGENGAIQPGDLLAASSTPGHAMKADSDAPQGTVIGKALEPLAGDLGVIFILVMLQ